jgi:hypothetical protein
MLAYPHYLIVQLIIAYTLTGALIFTVIVTCLSLVGWIRFADRRQQNKLFYALILELTVLAVAFFSGFINFNPVETTEKIEQYYEERFSRDQLFASSFDWSAVDGYLDNIFAEHRIPETMKDAYRSSLIHQLIYYNKAKILIDEYTYQIEVRNKEDGTYVIERTRFKESDAVVDYLREKGIVPDRNLLNSIYHSLNMFSNFSSDDLIEGSKLYIYRTEKQGLRFLLQYE